MPLITRADLARVAPHAAAVIASAIVDHADDVLPRYGLATAERLPDFLAHVLVESAYLTTCAENLSYSAERAHAVWPSRFPTVASAEPYARNPEALAEKVYGGRMGNTGPNDGWLFRGQGLLETTGRGAVEQLAAHLGKTLEATLLLLTSPEGMLECAAANYVLLGAPAHADRGDIVATTRCVNGGLNGLADRRAALALCRKVWPRVPRAAAPPALASTPRPAAAPLAAPVLPSQPQEPPVPESPTSKPRMPVFVSLFLGLFGVGAAQAAPIGASPAHGPLLFWSLALGFVLAVAVHRSLPRLRFRDALKLAAVLLLAGAGVAQAGTVDLSPLAQAAIDDFAVPMLLGVAPTVAAILVMPLRRYLDQRSALDMTSRVNDVLDKAIAFGAKATSAKVAAGDLTVDVDGVVPGLAVAYANDHASQLMQRAAGAAGPALDRLLEQKVVARLDSHPDVLALKATVAARAPLQLVGAAA